MRNYKPIFEIVVFVFTIAALSWFSSSKNHVIAQSCSCSISISEGECGTRYDPISGTTTETCENSTVGRSVSGSVDTTGSGATVCAYFATASACYIRADGRCQLNVGSEPGSCPFGGSTPAPTPACFCGDGPCNCGESNATCPGDCPLGSTPAPTPAPTPPPANGACGSCSGCYAPNPDPCGSACANINGVCSKAGYCGCGGGSVPRECWIDGLYYPQSPDTICTSGVNEGSFSSSTVRVPVGQRTRFCVRIRGRGGEPAGFTVSGGTTYSAGRRYYPGSADPIFDTAVGWWYGGRHFGGGRPYYANITGIRPGNGPVYLMSPDGWDHGSGFPEDPDDPSCSRTMNVAIESGTMDVYPNPVNLSVGSTELLFADVQPAAGNTIDSVIFGSRQPSIATAGTSLGPNPFVSVITGLTAGANTRVDVVASTSGGLISRTVRVNVSPNAGPDCNITSVTPNPPVVGALENVVATCTDPEGHDVDQVEFEVREGGGAWTPIGIDNVPAVWSTNWTPTVTGNYTLRCRGTDEYGSVGPWSNYPVSAIDPAPWWQVIGGGVSANGNVRSSIPITCASDPTCIDKLILDSTDTGSAGYPFPATVTYDGTADFNSGTGTGNVSTTGWLSETESQEFNQYTYDYFANLASGKQFGQLQNNVASTGTFNSAINSTSPDSNGFYWLNTASSGDLTINAQLNLNGEKIVVFVDGNLRINERIRVSDPSDTFLMFLVNGDIVVDSGVVGVSSEPALTGIFFSTGTFTTESSPPDDQFIFRGSIAALGGFSLNRDLEVANQNTPAELFYAAPEMLTQFPEALKERHLIWREIAP